MQFRVPQFIDVEDKIFGPFTFKQFLYMGGGAGLAYIIARTLPLIVAIILVPAILGLAAALTFARINNKPFAQILEYYLKFSTQSKLYIWKKAPPKKKTGTTMPSKAADALFTPKFTDSRLKDIAWSLDVLDMNRKI